VTHYIRSRSRLSYDDDGNDQLDPEHNSLRITHALKFVPAVGLSTSLFDPTTPTPTSDQSGPADVANWYKSLSRQDSASPVQQQHQQQQPPSPPDTPLQILDVVSEPLPTNRPSATLLSSPRPRLPAAPKRQQQWHRVRERDWFVSRPISHSASTPTSSDSLADILSRNPPAIDQPFRPPVFLHLGPSNRGWVMLQNQGWSEGEVLGSTRNSSEAGPSKRQSDHAHLHTETSLPTLRINEKKKRKKKNEKNEKEGVVNGAGWRLDSTGPPTSPSEARTTEATHNDEIDTVKAKVLLRKASVPVIDLTLSDDTDDEENPKPESEPDGSCAGTSATMTTTTAHMTTDPPHTHAIQTALLTPLPTVLKSDRLGIGLKAKTEGPYRASVKRVTHNAAALAAHVKASEDMRHAQRRFGKGRRAFARIEHIQRESRQNMMACLSEP
jgi:hypothetical protein